MPVPNSPPRFQSPGSFSRSTVLALLLTASALPVFAQDGSYDPTFGNIGRTWIDVTTAPIDSGFPLIRLPNGNFFMGGSCGTSGGSYAACAAWLTPSGSLATGYGPSGTGTAWFSAFPGWPAHASEVRDAVALPDGRVAMIIDTDYFAVLRADGTGLDGSIGNGAGYTTASFEAVLLRATSQGQFIVAGATSISAGLKEVSVARYDSLFRLDTTFGSQGVTTVSSTVYTLPNGMTLQRDGKIVVISVIESSPEAVGIVRLTAGGTLDPDFGINYDGKFESTLNNTYGASGNAITEDKEGRLVFVGYANTDASGGGEWLVDRLLSGGAVDPGFNGGHAQQFTIASSSTGFRPQARCVALQSDNRIVVAGTMDRDGSGDTYFALSRFNTDGSFDATFGGGGQSYGDMSPEAPDVATDQPSAMAIVPGGIVVGGSTKVLSGEIRFSAAKERVDLLFADDFE